MKRGITYGSSSSRKNELRFETCSMKTKHVSFTNISNKAKNKNVTESQGHLSGGANMFPWWGNERGWWGISPPFYMLKNGLLLVVYTVCHDEVPTSVHSKDIVKLYKRILLTLLNLKSNLQVYE